MTTELPQMKIRLPIDLKEKIQQMADDNNRSMNAEIVNAIEQYIKPVDRDLLFRLKTLEDMERANKTSSDEKLLAIQKILFEK